MSAPDVNWDNPINGIPVPSVQAAQLLVPFQIYEARGLGQPTAIFVSPIDQTPRDLMVVAFVYDSPEFGRLALKEHFPDVPADQYVEEIAALADLTGEPHVHGAFSS